MFICHKINAIFVISVDSGFKCIPKLQKEGDGQGRREDCGGPGQI